MDGTRLLVVPRIVAAGYRRPLRCAVDRLRHGPAAARRIRRAEARARVGLSDELSLRPVELGRHPRWGRRGLVLVDPDADDLSEHVRTAVRLVADRAPDERIAFVKSWNEWAEGNHLEPDRRHGRRRLEAVLAVWVVTRWFDVTRSGLRTRLVNLSRRATVAFDTKDRFARRDPAGSVPGSR